MYQTEKIIGLVEDRNPNKKNIPLNNNIRIQIKTAKDQLIKLFYENRKVIPNICLPKITETQIPINENPIIAITNNFEKEKFRIVIFQKEYTVKDLQSDWLIHNKIKYLVELIPSNTDKIKWLKSDNFFSIRVLCSVDQLHIALLDIFIDSMMEGTLHKNKKFKSIYSKTNLLPESYITFKKILFAKKQFNIIIEDGISYIPFSTFFRGLNSVDYDIQGAYNTWQRFLLETSDNLKSCSTLKSPHEVVSLLPKRYHQQVNIKSLNYVFKNKCKKDGFYYYVYLKRGKSGCNHNILKQLKSTFNAYPKIGSQTFIPIAFGHALNGLEHLCLIIMFEKVS